METNQNAAITPHNPLEGERPEINFRLQDGSDEYVSIIVVSKDRPAYLNICLQSIVVCSANRNYEIIVVDNNSGEETQAYLDEIEGEVKVIRNKENLHWSQSINKGVEAADKNSKYFIFMHCDVVVINPAWIDLLMNISENQNSGLVGVEMQTYFMQNQKIDFVQEWCMLMTRDCWKDIGPMPESLPIVGSNFIMTMRAQHKGYKPQVMKNPICHHYKIFSIDINEFEVMIEKAMAAMPKLIREIQTTVV